jgi:hypothetical protein
LVSFYSFIDFFFFFDPLIPSFIFSSSCSRQWDTYHAEVDGFAIFHQYVCAAFLKTFSKAVLDCGDFQAILLLLQKLPTEHWGSRDIDLLVAEAFRLKFTFQGAQSHISAS